MSLLSIKSHNPYFNRWFSAINEVRYLYIRTSAVTILILIDGFLQYSIPPKGGKKRGQSQSLF